MNKREWERRARQDETLRALGFTADECDKLRRISNTLQRWYELECGTDQGCIERDEFSGIPQWRRSSDTARLAGAPIPDREAGAKRRLAGILQDRNLRSSDKLTAFIQGDPRGAALYILRPGDVPAGQPVDAYYTRGICVY